VRVKVEVEGRGVMKEKKDWRGKRVVKGGGGGGGGNEGWEEQLVGNGAGYGYGIKWERGGLVGRK